MNMGVFAIDDYVIDARVQATAVKFDDIIISSVGTDTYFLS